WRIDDGVRYTFPAGVMLPPNGRLVIAGDLAEVQAFYGLSSVFGPFEGRLDNDGERIELRDAADALVCEVEYDTKAPWPTGGKDDGRSIELIDLWKNHNVGRHWAPSQVIMGTPGAPNGTGAPPPVKVVMNEFLADPGGAFDWLELF